MTTPNLTISWAGVTESGAGGYFPPDCGIAAGVNYVCTTVNDHFDVYSKTGAHVIGESLQTLFNVPGSDFVFDPQVTYDQNSGRFVVIADNRTGSSSSIDIAISRDGNPLDGWYTFSTGVGLGNSWLDHPLLGLDGSTLYVEGNYFDFTTGNYTQSGVWAWNLQSLEAGVGATAYFYSASSFGGFNDQFAPAHMYGAESGVSNFLIEYEQLSGTDYINVVRVNNAGTGTGSFSRQMIAVGNISDQTPTGALQSGNSTTLDDGETSIQDAVWRGNRLYAVTEIRVGFGSSAHDVVHWFVVDTSNLNALTLISQGNIDFAPINGLNWDTYYGNLTVDDSGNLIIGFSVSGSSLYASSMYAVIPPNASGLTDGGNILGQGLASYVQLDNLGRDRWGDYSGIAIDPTDGKSFWVFNQYANSGNAWATSIGEGHIATGASLIASHDFNGDGRSDILWRNNSSGLVYAWLMNGSTTSSIASLGGGTDWSVAGTGDFNGDGKSDILWRSNSSGLVYEWLMNGSIASSIASLGGGTDWSIAGTGDFSGDGKSDILWRSNSSGLVYEWLMNGSSPSSIASLGGGTDWSIAGTGDFNGDGKSDILWQSNSSGLVYEWLMNGSSPSSIASLGGGTDWSIAGTGDFNGDGKSDILWRSNSSGLVYEWLMNGSSPSSIASLGGGTDWSIAGTGDFNGDRKSDILWRSNSTGLAYDWLMNGTTPSTIASLGGGTGWSVPA
ncbi:VCBS repeat-containing protein [Bradyrhizobium sp. SZCCHNRI3037]|uniref:VCBS repeat-containing protein n=1 Tax=Bradyrhizobium sp. SZCCHNRI3037 TaxID=3057290 RepID=UPI0029169F23|nr:VCBS repeat-containing protein [Bradyrhizobium sp. SZCCHNRI3037]